MREQTGQEHYAAATRHTGRLRIRHILALALIFGFGCISPGASGKAPNLPREVLAFYYGWYANPSVSGQWMHWKDVDAQHKHIGSTKDFPSLNAYDSHDPKLVAEQISTAQAAGITGFIASWWGQGDFTDKGMRLILDTARPQHFLVSAYYETIRGIDESARMKSAISDLSYLLTNYGSDPAWLKVNGRPVVFIYGRAVEQISPEAWNSVFTSVRGHYRPGAVFIADSVNRRVIAEFDGVSVYNVTPHTQGMTPQQMRPWARGFYRDLIRLAELDKIATVTVIPGYDDTATRPPPRPTTARWGDNTYRVLWEEAVRADPNFVLITSWNEWHEGSQLESSAQYGSHFVDMTKRYANEFISKQDQERR